VAPGFYGFLPLSKRNAGQRENSTGETPIGDIININANGDRIRAQGADQLPLEERLCPQTE
jgi:hypothetical protein